MFDQVFFLSPGYTAPNMLSIFLDEPSALEGCRLFARGWVFEGHMAAEIALSREWYMHSPPRAGFAVDAAIRTCLPRHVDSKEGDDVGDGDERVRGR